VWISTSNPRYVIDGIRPGAAITLAADRFRTGRPYRIALDDWYIGAYRSTRVVMKVRHGIVEELGIGNWRLTSTRKAARQFMSSFR